jgi:hypothetical protein
MMNRGPNQEYLAMHTRIFAACALSIVACTVDLRAQAKPGGAAKGTAGAPAIGGSPAVRREAPGDDYFDAFVPYYSGEYRVALAAFQNAAKGGIRSTDGRWVDSICYHAMIGECYYQMGSLPQALDQYNSALKIYLAYQDWMLRVSFPPNLAVQTGVLKNPVNWGVSNRNVAIGKFDDKYLALQGHFNNQAVLERGGALSDPQQFPLHVKEIVRCVILSLRRRAELLGPVGPYDPETDNARALESNLVRRAAGNGIAGDRQIPAGGVRTGARTAGGRTIRASVQLRRAAGVGPDRAARWQIRSGDESLSGVDLLGRHIWTTGCSGGGISRRCAGPPRGGTPGTVHSARPRSRLVGSIIRSFAGVLVRVDGGQPVSAR